MQSCAVMWSGIAFSETSKVACCSVLTCWLPVLCAPVQHHHRYKFFSFCLTGLPHPLVLQKVNAYCKMTSEELFHLPLNVYIIILGIGLFILMLSLIFCCYMFRYNIIYGTNIGIQMFCVLSQNMLIAMNVRRALQYESSSLK